jgi:hypothetical protein
VSGLARLILLDHRRNMGVAAAKKKELHPDGYIDEKLLEQKEGRAAPNDAVPSETDDEDYILVFVPWVLVGFFIEQFNSSHFAINLNSLLEDVKMLLITLT